MSVNVRNGTPIHGPSLCATCVHAHIERGYRESEQVTFCRLTYFDHRVTFPVRSCTNYTEMKRQTLRQMEDIAWILMPREGKRVPGFVRPDEIAEGHEIEIELKKNS